MEEEEKWRDGGGGPIRGYLFGLLFVIPFWLVAGWLVLRYS